METKDRCNEILLLKFQWEQWSIKMLFLTGKRYFVYSNKEIIGDIVVAVFFQLFLMQILTLCMCVCVCVIFKHESCSKQTSSYYWCISSQFLLKIYLKCYFHWKIFTKNKNDFDERNCLKSLEIDSSCVLQTTISCFSMYLSVCKILVSIKMRIQWNSKKICDLLYFISFSISTHRIKLQQFVEMYLFEIILFVQAGASDTLSIFSITVCL